jgi:tryptophanyl-tRNA synthetase
MARDMAQSFNHLYGEHLVLPEAEVDESVALLPGLDGRKMSKSYNNAVFLSDPPKEIDQKLSRMMTDPARVRRTDPGEPEKCPAFELHKIYCTPEEIGYVSKGCRTAGIGCLECKKVMIKRVIGELTPIQEKRAALEKRPQEMHEVMAAGNRVAQEKASETMAEVREALGL